MPPLPEDNGFTGFEKPFADSLQNAGQAVPGMLARAGQDHRDARFNIYRNNVYASLVQAIEDGYPVVKRLVGDEFFRAMALEFVRENLPTSPVMMTYGAGFPDFLDRFSPVQSLPYLPDVARLEWLYVESFHSEDAGTLAMEVLLQQAGDRLDQVELVFHPALRLLSSPYAVLSVWNANGAGVADGDIEMPDPIDDGEDIMLVRPSLDVGLCWLQPGTIALLAALQEGKALGKAAGIVMASHPEAGLQQMLEVIFESGAVTGYSL